MDLDARQSRGFFSAGAVAFPTPFPSTGTISLAVGKLTYAVGQQGKDKNLLLVQEYRRSRTVVRLMLQADVSAVFIPGVKDDGRFRISKKPRVDNFEKGEWFLDDDVNVTAIRDRLNLDPQDDITSRNSILRGIVFIPEERRILRITEVAVTAGADDETLEYPCTCCWGDGCSCCWGGGCTCCCGDGGSRFLERVGCTCCRC